MPEHGIYLIGLCFQFAMSFFAFIHHLKYSIMKNFMDENFLLQTETAQKLYHEHAGKNADYRLSLPLVPQMVADDHKFKSLTEIWLGGDQLEMACYAYQWGRRTLLYGKRYF